MANELAHDNPNIMTYAPSEDSDQPGHPPSLISLRYPHEERLGPYLTVERTAKDSDQADHAGRTGNGVGSRMPKIGPVNCQKNPISYNSCSTEFFSMPNISIIRFKTYLKAC